MREKLNLHDDILIDGLHVHFGLNIVAVEFLPIGYDPVSAVYRVTADNGQRYFLKLKAGRLHLPSLLVPRALIEHGVANVVAPLRTVSNELWCQIERYSAILYPFIDGENAQVAGMSDQQWLAFGATLKAIHDSDLATQFHDRVPHESFALASGALVRRVQRVVAEGRFDRPSAKQFAAFWNRNAQHIQQLVERAELLGKLLQSRTFDMVLCHADIHAANI